MCQMITGLRHARSVNISTLKQLPFSQMTRLRTNIMSALLYPRTSPPGKKTTPKFSAPWFRILYSCPSYLGDIRCEISGRFRFWLSAAPGIESHFFNSLNFRRVFEAGEGQMNSGHFWGSNMKTQKSAEDERYEARFYIWGREKEPKVSIYLWCRTFCPW